MINALLVPMNLDVLRAARSTGAAGSMMDVENLPWSSPAWGRDVNADTPFMASAIVAAPFNGPQRVLGAGFHLHWALPDALCHGKIDQQTGKVSFPTVPNRWLVTRVIGTSMTRWVVESDYIWPKLWEWPKNDTFPRYRRGLAVTLLAHDLNDSEQPFQHVGRAFSWTEWKEMNRAGRMGSGKTTADGAGKLTAVGYGDVTFAAYQPHCHSVFGFFDSWEGSASVPDNVEYRVVGWYSDTNQDPLAVGSVPWTKSSGTATPPTWTLDSHLWKVTAAEAPQRTLCFGSTKVVAGASESDAPCVAAVANTGTEAMSVFLAEALTSDAELRAKIEDQLEALQMRTVLYSRDLDLAARLRAARHERGFHPESGALRWQLTVSKVEYTPSGVRAQMLDENLRALDRLEAELHIRTLEHRAAQQALYSDWCKYMSVAYRPPDEDPNKYLEIDDVKDYIERVHLRKNEPGATSVIEEKAALIAKVKLDIAATLSKMSVEIEAHCVALVAAELAARGSAAAQLLAAEFAAPGSVPLKLEQVPGPQFWRPNDPVVLMTGGGIRTTRRYGQATGGYLTCRTQAFSTDPWAQTQPDFSMVADGLAVPTVIDSTTLSGFSASNGKPWNPIFLEWGVDLYPVEGNTDQRFSGQGSYDRDVVTDNYDIPSHMPDLQPRVGLDVVADPDRYSGRCFLSSHAGSTVAAQMCALITEELLEAYGPLNDERNTVSYRAALATWHEKAKDSVYYPADTSQPSGYRFEPKQRAALETWYLTRPLAPNGQTTFASWSETQRFDDPMWTAIRALKELYDSNGERRVFLSASLDGFNDELLGFANDPVLPIDEPIGFGPYRTFSQTVGKLTGQRVATPEPNNPYSPIRTGELEVSALRVLDSFGQMLNVEPTRVIGAIRHTYEGRKGAIYFPPRVVQAMNVKFRWLEAERREIELANSLDNEVICGWLVPNPGAHSITVFSKTGVGLGLLTIDRDQNYVEWVPAPGQPAMTEISNITSRQRDVLQMNASIGNAHLRRVVDHIWSAPTAYMKAFVDSLVDAQENIDPEGGSQYSSLAMLTGRPLAVGRAELDIYPLQEAATRGDWLDFERRVRGQPQSDTGFQQVRFPLRVGEYGQLEDGVAGYWIENSIDGSFAGKCFYAQAADDVASLGNGKFSGDYQIEAHMKTTDDGSSSRRFVGATINIRQAIADAPLSVTMIFDPRGVVHLTTGILPTKVISVPPSCFVEAIQSIELWFKAGPLLARQGKNDLPLPSDPEYEVVWRESAWRKTATGVDDTLTWDDLRTARTIRGDWVLEGITTLKLATGLESLVTHYWLTKADENGIRFKILPKEKRVKLGLGDAMEKALSDYLDERATQIDAFLTTARFEERTGAREGWVVFQHLSTTNT